MFSFCTATEALAKAAGRAPPHKPALKGSSLGFFASLGLRFLPTLAHVCPVHLGRYLLPAGRGDISRPVVLLRPPRSCALRGRAPQGHVSLHHLRPSLHGADGRR